MHAMDTIGYLIFGYLGLGILLGIRAKYFYERFLRYVYKQYPDEEVSISRLHEYQWYSWAKSQKLMDTLVREKTPSDPELRHWARKSSLGVLYVVIWFGLFILVFAISAIHHLITTQ